MIPRVPREVPLKLGVCRVCPTKGTEDLKEVATANGLEKRNKQIHRETDKQTYCLYTDDSQFHKAFQLFAHPKNPFLSGWKNGQATARCCPHALDGNLA